MTDDAPQPNQPQPNQPTFDPSAPHQQRPKVRALRAFPLQAKGPDGQPIQMLGLADHHQISSKMVATLPAAQVIFPLMDGSHGIDEIVTTVGRGLTREFLEQLVAQLDDACLIEGPRFDEAMAEVKKEFDSTDTLPPGSTAQFADALAKQELGENATDEQLAEVGPAKLREIMDKWIDASLKDATNPAFDELPKAVVAPHIDYQRGAMNYAHVYGRLRTAKRPDRVVVLGTNHFGFSTGICLCDKGFESPLGTSPLDTQLLEAVKARLGAEGAEQALANRFDHEREHSIELHLPWIQHCLGPADESEGHVPVFAALIHDPCVNSGESYDGKGLALDPFVEALKGALDEVGGTTLIVSSADLSHVGPSFGDQQSLAGDTEEAKQARNRVAAHDQEMLKLFCQNKPDDLVASMSWQQNPTRWCSVGNMVAAARLAEPQSINLINYAAAMDQQGMTFVSHAAIAMA